MFDLKISSCFIKVVLLSFSLIATAYASTNEPIKEKAVVHSFSDSKLEWGPCPEFIPKGCEIAVLNGDPAKNNVDIYFKVPADFTIPHHWHTSQERMVLVSGELEVRYDEQDPVVIKTGEYAYGPAKLPHIAYCKKGDPCVLYIGFVAPLDAFPIEEKK